MDSTSSCVHSTDAYGCAPPPSKRFKQDLAVASKGMEDQSSEQKTNSHSSLKSSVEKCNLSVESSDLKVNVKKKFLVDMPDDFYQFWELCKSLNPSRPEAALKSSLGLLLVGPYHVLAGKLEGVPWEKCILHFRYYYDPPETLTVLSKDGDDSGFHIGYFRDDPKDMKCLVVSNCVENGCEVHIEGDSIFSAVRHQIAGKLNSKQVTGESRKVLQGLDKHITSFMTARGLVTSQPTVKDLWKWRHRETVAKCFNKIGIVVPYDKETELGYRPLTMSDGELKKLLNKIVTCTQDEAKRDKFSEPLQEVVTFVQFANDECDYGMGLELGLDLFCHGDPHFHKLIEHLLPLAYELLHREEFSKICTLHLKERHLQPQDFSC